MKLPNIFEDQTPPENYPAGATIFDEGQTGDCMYIVKSGSVELRWRGILLEVVTEDGYFGEMAIIDGGPRSAAAIAATDTVLIPVNKKRFEYMIHEIPFFAVHVMQNLCRRLRERKEIPQ
jgi:CRP-like cAMP-binding protein